MAGGLREWGGRLRSWGGAKISEMKSLKTSQLAPGSPEGREDPSRVNIIGTQAHHFKTMEVFWSD